MATHFSNDQGDGYIRADGFSGPATGAGITPKALPATFPNGIAATAGTFLALSTSSGLTAHASGGQTNALLLTSQLNVVTTVANANDSLKLPVTAAATSTAGSTVGRFVVVVNTTVTSLQVYGSGTDTINAVATGTGVAVAGGKTAIFFNNAVGTWVGPIALA